MSCRIIAMLFCAALPVFAFAQKTQVVKGEYTYYAPSTVSLEQARRIVVERARTAALADAFGTVVQSTTITSVHNGDERSSVDVSTLAADEVRGEWLEDVAEPRIEVGYEDGMLVLRAYVSGRARRIEASTVDFTAMVLRNGTDSRFESDSFADGDDMYLYFKTPVAGWLAVYLLDDESQTAYCLLPYRADTAGAVAVSNKRDYLFFSAAAADDEASRAMVDEYVLTSDSDVTYNRIAIIFSTNEFAKPVDVQSDEMTLPRETSVAEFRRWLSRSRMHDNKMAVKQLTIKITR